jgi:protein phosphatase 2C family protein 2/3
MFKFSTNWWPAEQRGPGIQHGEDDHENYESHMDASEVLHRLARGIILLPDGSGYGNAQGQGQGQQRQQGSIQPLGEDDTEMFDNSDEEDDLGSQVHKTADTHEHAEESRNTRGETPAPEASQEKKTVTAPAAGEETLSSKAHGQEEKSDVKSA